VICLVKGKIANQKVFHHAHTVNFTKRNRGFLETYFYYLKNIMLYLPNQGMYLYYHSKKEKNNDH
jgi:hypothetical protein